MAIGDPEAAPFAAFQGISTALSFAASLRDLTSEDIYVINGSSGKVETKVSPFPELSEARS